MLFALHKIAPAIAEDGSVMSGALKDLTDKIGVNSDALIPQMHDMLTQAVANSLKHFGETDEQVHDATERLQFEVSKAVEQLMEMATQDRQLHEQSGAEQEINQRRFPNQAADSVDDILHAAPLASFS